MEPDDENDEQKQQAMGACHLGHAIPRVDLGIVDDDSPIPGDHGFFKSIMRSLAQLRPPQNGPGEHPESDRVRTQGTGDAPVRLREPQIEMAHGAGKKASRRLMEGFFGPLLFPSSMGPLGDSAHLQISGTRVAITTDSFVVKTLSFSGGSIGELAVNHLGVSGAKTENLDCTYAIEAGLPTLWRTASA